MAIQVWAFNRPSWEDERKAVVQSIKDGKSRFGWSCSDTADLRKFYLNKENAEQRFLTRIKPGDWIVHVNLPQDGKCIAAKVTSEYMFDEGVFIAERNCIDFRHCICIDPTSAIEFWRKDPNVKPSVNLKPRSRQQRVLAVDDFLTSIENLKGGTVSLKSIDNDCENEKSGEALQNNVASMWQHKVMVCSKCCDEYEQPILKPNIHRKGKQDLRWRNRYRVPHIGSKFGVIWPRIVFVGLEDPYPREKPVEPLAEMVQLEEYLTTSLGSLDRHRWGELYLAHDLLGISGDSMGAAIFMRVATINSHPCSLVEGDGKKSASNKLRNTCDCAWSMIFTELEPDILVLEGKQVVWDEAYNEVKNRGWQIIKEELVCQPASDKVRLYNVHAPSRDFFILALNHPSARGIHGWNSRNCPYYRDVITPVVTQLRTLRVIPPCAP